MLSLFGGKAKKAKSKPKGGYVSGIALFPLFLFVAVFVGAGVYFTLEEMERPFYQVSAAVAILPSLIFAVLLSKEKLNTTLDQFLEGSGHLNIITMVFIFLLAGAFSEVTQEIGGVKHTVNFGTQFISGYMLLPGIFLIASFIALAMGTSMGTIAAMTPIALGIAEATDLSVPLTVGSLVGGAMFGDNLSMISDTTIASIQTQICELKDKFRLNFSIAFPAMVVTVLLLANLGTEGVISESEEYELLLILPYVLVLIMALLGINVMIVLTTGILIAGGIGFYLIGDFTPILFAQKIFSGFQKMTEIVVLSLMIGGLGELVKQQGGLRYLIKKIGQFTKLFSKKDKSRVVGELGICSLVSVVDMCTANNTVAILIAGEPAREIAEKNGVEPRRSATLIDIFSCVIQGILPYSAQVLLVGSLADISPLTVIMNNYYCYILGAVALISVITGYPSSIFGYGSDKK